MNTRRYCQRPRRGLALLLHVVDCRVIVSAICISCFAGATSWANPSRVADINPTQEPTQSLLCSNTSVNPAVVLGGLALFCGKDRAHGAELWSTDGSVAGTELLLDLLPGPANGSPSDLVLAGDKVYFIAITAANERELWQSDGTTAGTRRVAETEPDLAGVSVRSLAWDGSRLFFASRTPARGWEPAVLESGVVEFFDLIVGEVGSDPSQFVAKPGGGEAYFSASTSGTGYELFMSDGTSGGTGLVLDLVPGPGDSSPRDLTFLGANGLFFSASTANDGRELVLWKTDALIMVPFDIEPGPGSSSPYNLVANGTSLFYTAETTAHGRELWRYLSSGSTNSRLSDINPDGGDGLA